MSNAAGRDDLTPVLRTSQVIVGALVAGCIMFLVIALVISADHALDNRLPMLTYLAVGVAGVLAVLRTVIPGVVVSAGRGKIRNPSTPSGPDHGSGSTSTGPAAGDRVVHALGSLFVTKTIVGAAILEGAAFFCLVAYLVEKSPLALTLAVLLIFALALQIPTRSTLERWIEQQTRLLDQERHLQA